MKVLLLAFLFLLIADLSYSQSQVPPPTPPKAGHQPKTDPGQQHENTAIDQRGTETFPLFIKVIPSFSVNPEPSKEHEQTRDYTSSEWWLVYVTAILTVVTLVLAIFTGNLWASTKKTSEYELRAYVGVERVSIEGSFASTNCWSLSIENFGKTMVLNDVVKISTVQIIGEGCSNGQWIIAGNPIVRKTIAIMPNESVGFKYPITLQPVGHASIRLNIRIDYYDIFDQPHHTYVCFTNGKKNITLTENWTVEQCDNYGSQHNSAE